MARMRINTRTHTKEKPYLINSYFFSKLIRQKNSIGWAKKVYVCVWDMCWRNFCNFPWWLENVKSRWKIALFSNERHFEIWFPKKGSIWSKLSKLHQKDPILHVVTTFPLKQGEKRTSNGPTPHPLNTHNILVLWISDANVEKKSLNSFDMTVGSVIIVPVLFLNWFDK